MASSIRLKFSRKGPVCYIGHLDLLRYFQKAISRSNIKIKYSNGFNPHQIISFAYPLGVSMETEGDYLDIDVEEFDSLEQIVNDLNQVLNEGIKIISASLIPENALNAMASVASADYMISIENGCITQDMLDEYLAQNEIMVMKEGKKGEKLVNIRDGIYKLLVKEEGIFMSLASGSSQNIKPQTIIDTINSKFGTNIEVCLIKRIEIYREENGKFYPLGEF